MKHSTPTLSDLIIAHLGSARSTRAYHRILRERAFARANPASVRTAFHRLQRGGYVRKENSGWAVTKKKYVKQSFRTYIPFIVSPFEKNTPDYAIVSFDIPETKRPARNWLRKQLKLFGYRMIQQSVWVGPGPLPVSFGNMIKVLGIKENIRIFKLN